MLLLGVCFYLVLTCKKRDEDTERRVIAGGSRAAAAAAGVAEGSQDRAVQQVGLLGIHPVLESPGRACRACCTVHKQHKDCNPWASGSTCMDMDNRGHNMCQ